MILHDLWKAGSNVLTYAHSFNDFKGFRWEKIENKQKARKESFQKGGEMKVAISKIPVELE